MTKPLTAPRRAVGLAALVLLAASVATAQAEYPVAPDVVVFCEPTLRQVVTELGAQWRKENGIPVRVFVAPTWSNLAQLTHHTRDDVIIGEGDAAAVTAAKQNLLKGEPVLRLWQNKLVVAALASELQKTSASSSPGSLNLASIAGKASVAIVDPGVDEAGDQTKQALQALGLWDAVSAKSIGVVGTADAAFLLSAGNVKLAVLYATDLAGHPDFAVTDILPAAKPPIVYWAAQTQRAMSPNTAKFLDFLRRPAVRNRGKDAGLEVLP